MTIQRFDNNKLEKIIPAEKLSNIGVDFLLTKQIPRGEIFLRSWLNIIILFQSEILPQI